MNTPKPIQIFKPGTHTAMSGAALDFSEKDLAASAAAYDPAKHEAPIVVGHPQSNAPAYGWVKSVAFADGALNAEPQQVDPAFAEMVGAGRFKKVSASFYSPDSPQNPVPGVYYLRHVGFLGAQPPAVKGLRAPEFAENEEGVVEFGDWDDTLSARLWRSLKNFLIGKYGQAEADQALDEYTVQSLADSAAQPEPDDAQPTTAFSEKITSATAAAQSADSHTGENEMSEEDKKQLAELKAENAALKAAQVKQGADARHADHAAFAEGLAKEGKLLPVHKSVVTAALDALAEPESQLEFAEGETKKPLATAFREFLAAQPKQVEFGEIAGGDGSAASVEFAAPVGYTVDAAGLEVHQKALDYQEKHAGVDYVTAVKAVGG